MVENDLWVVLERLLGSADFGICKSEFQFPGASMAFRLGVHSMLFSKVKECVVPLVVSVVSTRGCICVHDHDSNFAVRTRVLGLVLVSWVNNAGNEYRDGCVDCLVLEVDDFNVGWRSILIVVLWVIF